MKWVDDTSGRFRKRPYYTQAELDNECEEIVTGYLGKKYGVIRFPLSTDDLTVMIERDTSDLDLYADLSGEGEDIEGLTDFFPHKRPAVRIARELSLESAGYHRLRTTLAHEYGHVKFHNFLWDFTYQETSPVKMAKKLSQQRRKLERVREKFSQENGGVDSGSISNIKTGPVDNPEAAYVFRCRQSRILDAPVWDWMEWQASYVGGAILMPLSALRNVVRDKVKSWDGQGELPADSEREQELITVVAEKFDVSGDAVKVRLSKLGYLQEIDTDTPAFLSH
jgi:hypothetical protein